MKGARRTPPLPPSLLFIHLSCVHRKRYRPDLGRDRSRDTSPRPAARRRISRSPLRRRSPSPRRRSRSSPRRRSPMRHRCLASRASMRCRGHTLQEVTRFLLVSCRSMERDRYGRLRQYRRSTSRDRDRRRRHSRDEDKYKGSLSEGMKVDQESSEEEV